MNATLAARERRINELSNLIKEGANYRWESDIERQIWTGVAQEFLKEHLNGKKTLISEACFRAHVDKKDVLLAESAARLNEGFFSGLKDMLGGGLAKTFGKAFGGTKSRNWWIFGGGGEKETAKYRQAYIDATEENQEVFAKLGNTTLKTLVDQIKGVIEDWPNGGSVKDFTDAMAKFDQFYQSVRTAAGANTTDGTPPPQGVAPKLSVDDANAIIKKLRQAMQFFDRELKDRYTYNLESRTRKVPTLVEALLLEAEDDDIGAEGRTTSSMEGLKSNLAAGVLAGLGLGSIAAGVIVQTDWFIRLTSTLKEVPQDQLIPATEEFIKKNWEIKEGDCFEFMLERGPLGTGESTGKPMSVFIDRVAALGNGNFEAGVKLITDPNDPVLVHPGAREMLMKLKDNPEVYGKTWDQFVQTTGTGSGSRGPIKDFLRIGSPRKIASTLAKEIPAKIIKGKTVVAAQTALASKLTALGPWGVGIGAGLVAAAASIKALRDYGAKNSRTTYFQAAVDLFKDIKPDEVEAATTIPEQPPFQPDPPQPGKVLVTLDNTSTKVVAPKDVVASQGFEIPKAYTLEEIPLNDKDKTKEEVVDYLESPQGQKSVQLADGKTAKDLEGLEFEVTDKRKKSSGRTTDPGKGTVSVVSIKDWKVPSLTSILFESTDESADVRVAGAEAKKSKTYKDLKKKFKNDPKNLPLPTGVSTKEDDVIKDTMKLTDDDFDLRATSKDADVQQGLNALRKKAKSGNVILTFSNKAHNKLAQDFQMSEDDIKKLLAIYSKKPESAPKIEAYKSILGKVKDEAKKKELRKFILDMGMAVGGGKAKKNESLDGDHENLIIERWSRLAGLI